MLAKKEIPKAASMFNAYNKKLGLVEPVHEKYVGTIFSKQQTGFLMSLESTLDRKLKTDQIQEPHPNYTL